MYKNEFLEEVKDLSRCAIQNSNNFLKLIDRDVSIDWNYDFETFDKTAIGVYEHDSVHTGTMSIGMNINALWKVFKSETKNYPYTSEYKILQEMILTNVYHEVGHGICDYINDYLEYTDELDDLYDNNQELFDNVLDNEEDSVEEFAWDFYDNQVANSKLGKIINLLDKNLSEKTYKSLKKMLWETKDIPIDCGTFTEFSQTIPKYASYNYFGDCVNTLNVFGDATTMSQFVNGCTIINTEYVINKLNNGDRRLPKELINEINILLQKGEINNQKLIVSGINDYQRILFIYLTKTDKHYFFDCE